MFESEHSSQIYCWSLIKAIFADRNLLLVFRELIEIYAGDARILFRTFTSFIIKIRLMMITLIILADFGEIL